MIRGTVKILYKQKNNVIKKYKNTYKNFEEQLKQFRVSLYIPRNSVVSDFI